MGVSGWDGFCLGLYRRLEGKPVLPPPGRTPLKSWMVFFFRTDRLAAMPPFALAPEIDKGGE
jgi:hypothetical protein